MPKLSTPNLVYMVYDEHDRLRQFNDVDKAVQVAARTALRSEKNTSVFVHVKGYRPDDPPTSVIYVKVSIHPWE